MYQGTLRESLAFVAQLVEQWIEDPRVGGSIPSEGTTVLGLSGVNREPAEYGLQAKPLNLTYEQQDIRSQKHLCGYGVIGSHTSFRY